MEDKKIKSLSKIKSAQKGPNIGLVNVKASGLVRIIDKDGNVKSEMEITSVTTQELDNAT
jgi:hypothetical protein